MIKCVFSLKDVKAGFTDPYIDTNPAVAIRHVSNALKEKNDFSLNPDDFELWQLGTFDTETGIFSSSLNHIINVVDLMDMSAHA